MLATRERVRALLAGQIRVPAANVALTESTTQGVHVVVTGLGIGRTDDVVTTDAEHFGLTGPLLAAGARLQIAKVCDARADDVFDLIRAQITPTTRLIAISAVSWIDGTIFPWRELQEISGLPVLVDGAQSVGALDVDAAAADFYTVSAQKWLCGPDATGALYVRDPEALPTRLVSYPSAETYDIGAGTWEPKAGAARFDPVFTPASSLTGLEAALTDLPDGRFEGTRSSPRRGRRRSSRSVPAATRLPPPLLCTSAASSSATCPRAGSCGRRSAGGTTKATSSASSGRSATFRTGRLRCGGRARRRSVGAQRSRW
jgi:L-cysteine/cystine lyase